MRPSAVHAGSIIERTPSDQGLRAFSRAWLTELESLVAGAPVTGLDATRRQVQLICAERDRVSPWVVELSSGHVRRVRFAVARDATTAIVHSTAVGWRMLGRRLQDFHRVDELVVEQLVDGAWTRHPIPPLDEGVIDLAGRTGVDAVGWHERVIGSPIGTLFVSRRLAAGRLSIFGASTRPPAEPSGVGSDVDWSDVMTTRTQAPFGGDDGDVPAFRRFWRGPTHETWRIRSLLAADDLHRCPPSEQLERDHALLDTLRVLEALGEALHAGATWRRLVRRTVDA